MIVFLPPLGNQYLGLRQRSEDLATVTSTDYSTAWRESITDAKGNKQRSYFDAFDRLSKVEELDASDAVYATTNYTYDILGNVTQIVDANSNTTTMSYDWLSRKTGMSDPDMGSWTYGYDSNGNITSHTDAKGQTITLTYDALNQLTGRTYPAGSGMTNVVYAYDSTSGGNYGKSRKTGMTDASGAIAWKYDTRGRVVQETRTVTSVDYTTAYTYDSAHRVLTVTYPTNEVVTNTYNGRGLPYGVSGSTAGTLADSTLYNQLGQVTRINLGNGTYSTFTYYGLDNSSGHYGRPWQAKTTKPNVGDLQSLTYTWDANGNLTQRVNAVASETEDFSYDFQDRLTAVSGAYSNSFSYNTIGNITSMNGASYTYGTKPHAVTAVGSTSYAYDANGNMVTRGSQTLTWDVENRLLGVSDNGTAMSAVYDGDGNRVKKTEGSTTVLYVNRFYEKDLSSSVETTHYYLGGREVAYRKGTAVEYVCQDHLGSTVLTVDSSGGTLGTVAYSPFGATRSSTGTLNTDELFTDQRLDQTGLYYYGARYYDATIGRFISADSIVQSVLNPQCLNRYSYCINNPLKYIDSSGNFAIFAVALAAIPVALATTAVALAVVNGNPGASGTMNAIINGTVDIAKDFCGAVGNGYTTVKNFLFPSNRGAITDPYRGCSDTCTLPQSTTMPQSIQGIAVTTTTTATQTRTQTKTKVQKPTCVYKLVATMYTKYDRWRYGMIPQKNAVKLRPGEVWKYGITNQFNGTKQWRYSEAWLRANHLRWERILIGTREYCLAMEKALIISYKIHNGGFLPPGNKIIG